MSAPEVAATPVAAVEEAKLAEAVPAPEPSVPAAEAPKPEEVAQLPVRLIFVYRFSSLHDLIQGGY
jgi:hypothetical protein